MPMKSSIKSLGSGTSMLHKHRMNIDHDGLTNKTKVDDSLNETI